LGYKEVVTFTDPTGDTADRYFGAAYASLFPGRASLSGPRVRPFPQQAGGSRGPNTVASNPYWY
jgi:hypothetical protein